MMRGGSVGSRLAASAERALNFCWRHSFSTLCLCLTTVSQLLGLLLLGCLRVSVLVCVSGMTSTESFACVVIGVSVVSIVSVCAGCSLVAVTTSFAICFMTSWEVCARSRLCLFRVRRRVTIFFINDLVYLVRGVYSGCNRFRFGPELHWFGLFPGRCDWFRIYLRLKCVLALVPVSLNFNFTLIACELVAPLVCSPVRSRPAIRTVFILFCFAFKMLMVSCAVGTDWFFSLTMFCGMFKVLTICTFYWL